MRNGKRWHGDYDYDFEQQAAERARASRRGELKQVTIGAVVGLSPGAGCL